MRIRWSLFVSLIILGLWIIAYDHLNQTSLKAGVQSGTGVIDSYVLVEEDRVKFQLFVPKVKETVQIFLRIKPDELEQIKKWRRGDLLRVNLFLQKPTSARNFGGFDYQKFLYHQRIHWISHLTSKDILFWEKPKKFHIFRFIDELRIYGANQIEKIFSSHDSAGLIKGLLIGWKADLDPGISAQFSQLGLSHLLAISGLHVGILLSCLNGLLRRMSVTRETRVWVQCVFLPCYIALTGFSPSVIRAGIMSMIVLLARPKARGDIVIYTAIGMLFFDPYLLYHIGFQFSFLLTFGLIFTLPTIQTFILIKNTWLQSLVAVSITAQLFSFPLTVYYFSQFSLLSLFSNLLIVPWISSVTLPVSMLAFVVSFIFQPAAIFIAKFIIYTNSYLFSFIEWLCQFSSCTLIWAKPYLLWVLLSYFFLFGIKYSIRMFIAASVILLVFGSYYGKYTERGVVSFIDVGQGDAAFITTPSGKFVLIDGGGTPQNFKRKNSFEVGKQVLVPLLKQRGVRSLEYVIVTHNDLDHYGGIKAVAEEIPIKHFIFNGTLKEHPHFLNLIRILLKKQVPMYSVQSDMHIQLDPLTRITFLSPEKRAQTGEYLAQQNDACISCMLSMQKSLFLFTADIDHVQERQILNKNVKKEEIQSVILKVAHHGSKYSTCYEWLTFWKPKFAIISVGNKNPYRHPHKETLDRLSSHNILCFRTDERGEIQIKTFPEDKIKFRFRHP